MYKLEITTSAWESLKQRLKIDSSRFTETITGNNTVIVFDDLTAVSDVFNKIAEDNQQHKETDQKIWEAYVNIITKKPE